MILLCSDSRQDDPYRAQIMEHWPGDCEACPDVYKMLAVILSAESAPATIVVNLSSIDTYDCKAVEVLARYRPEATVVFYAWPSRPVPMVLGHGFSQADTPEQLGQWLRELADSNPPDPAAPAPQMRSSPSQEAAEPVEQWPKTAPQALLAESQRQRPQELQVESAIQDSPPADDQSSAETARKQVKTPPASPSATNQHSAPSSILSPEEIEALLGGDMNTNPSWQRNDS